jgi:hypothetical protein
VLRGFWYKPINAELAIATLCAFVHGAFVSSIDVPLTLVVSLAVAFIFTTRNAAFSWNTYCSSMTGISAFSMLTISLLVALGVGLLVPALSKFSQLPFATELISEGLLIGAYFWSKSGRRDAAASVVPAGLSLLLMCHLTAILASTIALR